MSVKKLIQGFKTFRSSYFETSNHYDDLISKGQSPETLVIACSDSRNDPALVTQSEPGDIFVVRNVAAIVPPYEPDGHYHGTSAAIEFAVKGLKVKNIVILGHALCGGVKALSEGSKSNTEYEFLASWVSVGTKARAMVEKILGDADPLIKQRALEQAMILTSLNNLFTFPWVKSGVEAGQIKLYGWYFDLVNGSLLGYDFVAEHFSEVKHPAEGFSHPVDGCCCHGWPMETMVKGHGTTS